MDNFSKIDLPLSCGKDFASKHLEEKDVLLRTFLKFHHEKNEKPWRRSEINGKMMLYILL